MRHDYTFYLCEGESLFLKISDGRFKDKVVRIPQDCWVHNLESDKTVVQHVLNIIEKDEDYCIVVGIWENSAKCAVGGIPFCTKVERTPK